MLRSTTRSSRSRSITVDALGFCPFCVSDARERPRGRERQREREGIPYLHLTLEKLEPAMEVVVAGEVGEWSEWWWCFPWLLPNPRSVGVSVGCLAHR